MVKTPRTRHAKASRPPVTIDLEASEVGPAPEKAASPNLLDDPAVKAPAGTEAEPDPAVQARADAEAALTPGESAAPVGETPGDAGEETTGSEAPLPGMGSASADEPSTEAGTAVPPEQEYRPAEAMDADAGPIEEPSPRHEEPKLSATSVPPPMVVRKDGLGRVAAGIVGGVVALAIAGGLQAAGLLGYPGAGGGVDNSAEIAGLRGEIETLKGATDGSETTARVDELSRTLDSLRAEVATLRDSAPEAGADTAGLGARLDALEAEIARLSSGSVSSEELSSLGERVAAAETEARGAQQASASATDRLTALEQSVSSLTARVETQAQQPKIALAIATAALKAAVDRGAPFLAELETFAAIHPETPEIGTLREFAESGVPTRDALRAEMDAAATAMIAAATPADANAGFFDRLLASAESLVTVRPIGQVAGVGVPETLARMEVALNAGELDKALAEYETLPDPVRQAGAAFADRLKARADVERLVDQAIATAMRT